MQYVFRADYLLLSKHLMFSFLGKILLLVTIETDTFLTLHKHLPFAAFLSFVIIPRSRVALPDGNSVSPFVITGLLGIFLMIFSLYTFFRYLKHYLKLLSIFFFHNKYLQSQLLAGRGRKVSVSLKPAWST